MYGCVNTSYIPTSSEGGAQGPDVPCNHKTAYENMEPTYTEIPVTYANVPMYINVQESVVSYNSVIDSDISYFYQIKLELCAISH